MTTDHDDSVLAAEYVLCLLEAGAHAEAEQRAATDAAFAREVEGWRGYLSEFDETAQAITPGDDLWRRIEQEIASPAPVEIASAPFLLQRLWNNLAAVRIAMFASAVVALVCGAVAAVSLRHAQDVATRKPLYVAILVDDATKQAGAVINAFADGRVEMIPLTEINVPDGRVLEIWTLWDRAIGPRSVGQVTRARTMLLNLDKLPATGADQLFEITLEPAGGSPIGRPTGPILYKGTTLPAL